MGISQSTIEYKYPPETDDDCQWDWSKAKCKYSDKSYDEKYCTWNWSKAYCGLDPNRPITEAPTNAPTEAPIPVTEAPIPVTKAPIPVMKAFIPVMEEPTDAPIVEFPPIPAEAPTPKPELMDGMPVYLYRGSTSRSFIIKDVADKMCRQNSINYCVPNTEQAFLSFSSNDQIKDIWSNDYYDPNAPIKSPNSAHIIAENKSDLLDGTLLTSLKDAGVTNNKWWSGSTRSGSLSDNCQGWSSFNGTGMVGDPSKTDVKWISDSKTNCSDINDIICICSGNYDVTFAPTEAPTPAPTEAPTEAPTPAPTPTPHILGTGNYYIRNINNGKYCYKDVLRQRMSCNSSSKKGFVIDAIGVTGNDIKIKYENKYVKHRHKASDAYMNEFDIVDNNYSSSKDQELGANTVFTVDPDNSSVFKNRYKLASKFDNIIDQAQGNIHYCAPDSTKSNIMFCKPDNELKSIYEIVPTNVDPTLFLQYTADSYDPVTGIWSNLTDLNNSVQFDGFYVEDSDSTNSVTIEQVGGTTNSIIGGPNDKIMAYSGLLSHMFPSNFTICTVSKYNGPIKKRIFTGDEMVDILSGQYDGSLGTSYYMNKFITSGHVPPDNWVVICWSNGSSPEAVINGKIVPSTVVGIPGNPDTNFGINLMEGSDFAVKELRIYNTNTKNSAELLAINNELMSSHGLDPTEPTSAPTPAPTIPAPTPAPYKYPIPGTISLQNSVKRPSLTGSPFPWSKQDLELYVQANNNGKLLAKAKKVGSHEKFDFIRVGTEQFKLKSKRNEKYVRKDSNYFRYDTDYNGGSTFTITKFTNKNFWGNYYLEFKVTNNEVGNSYVGINNSGDNMLETGGGPYRFFVKSQ